MRRMILALFFSLPLLGDEPKPLPAGASLDIVVQEVQGDVDVRTDPKTQWQPATKGMKIPVGALVSTGDSGQAAISFGANSALVLTELSMLTIQAFGMQGDQLVAKVSMDPGVAHVSVKQLPQFRTDFEVSSPRLTCSVRGSGGWFYFWGDEVVSGTFCDDDEIRQKTAGQDRVVLVDGKGNANNESSQSIELHKQENFAPTGLAKQETIDANLLTIASTSTAIVISQVNQNITPTPSNGSTSNGNDIIPPPAAGDMEPDGEDAARTLLNNNGLGALVFFLTTGDQGHLQEAQSEFDEVNVNLTQDPIFVQKRLAILELREDSAFGNQLADRTAIVTPQEEGLLHLAEGGEDVSSHISQDGLPAASPTFSGGYEGATRDSADNVARTSGFQTFVDASFGPYLQGRVATDPTNLAQNNPALFAAIQSDFHADASGLDFVDLTAFLHGADLQARAGLVDPVVAGNIILSILHSEFEVAEMLAPPAQGLPKYTQEHTEFLSNLGNLHSLLTGHDVTDALTGFVITGDIDHFLAAYGNKAIDSWEETTGFKSGNHDKFDVNDPFYQPRQHFLGDMLTLAQAFRDATGTSGVASGSQEDFADSAILGTDDLRKHINNPNDPSEFDAVHHEFEWEEQISHVIGLKATFDQFFSLGTLRDAQKQQFQNPIFSGPGGQILFANRLADLKNINDFGVDAMIRDSRLAADNARAGTLTPGLFGTVIIEHTRNTEFRDIFGEQPGNAQTGQFDFDRSLLQTFVTDLNTALNGGVGYSTTFLNHFETAEDARWMAAHPGHASPLDPAHAHFLSSLSAFDNNARRAAPIPPPR